MSTGPHRGDIEPCLECGVPGCACEWCDYCQASINPWAHFGPDHDYGTMQRHDRAAASGATLPLDGCPPGCWYCARLAELIREADGTSAPAPGIVMSP